MTVRIRRVKEQQFRLYTLPEALRGSRGRRIKKILFFSISKQKKTLRIKKDSKGLSGKVRRLSVKESAGQKLAAFVPIVRKLDGEDSDAPTAEASVPERAHSPDGTFIVRNVGDVRPTVHEKRTVFFSLALFRK